MSPDSNTPARCWRGVTGYPDQVLGSMSNRLCSDGHRGPVIGHWFGTYSLLLGLRRRSLPGSQPTISLPRRNQSSPYILYHIHLNRVAWSVPLFNSHLRGNQSRLPMMNTSKYNSTQYNLTTCCANFTQFVLLTVFHSLSLLPIVYNISHAQGGIQPVSRGCD
jgi:hypothetical protein